MKSSKVSVAKRPSLLGSFYEHATEWTLGAVVLATILANIIWSSLELRPPHWDMGRHLLTSLDYLHAFMRGGKWDLLTQYKYYPPLLYWLTIPFYLIFGTSTKAALLVNIVFIIILAFSTYAIGKLLWSKRIGLLAVIMTLSTPMFVSQFKEYQLDAPLSAMIALSLYLLIKTKEFSSRRFSVLLGIAIGFSLLTKWTTPFILILPLGYALAAALYQVLRKKEYQRVTNIALTALSGYAVSSLWYVTNLHQLKIDLLLNGGTQGALEGDPVVGSLASNLWYVRNLLTNQFQLGFTILLVVGVTFLILNRRSAVKRNIYPILLVVGVLLFFTMLRNKDARYTLPMLPALSILSLYWVQYIWPRARRIVTLSIAAYCAFIFWSVSFGISFLPKEVTLGPEYLPVSVYAQHGYIIGAPTSEQWYLEKVMKLIASDSAEKTVYYSGADTIWFNSWGMQYYARLYNVEFSSSMHHAGYILVRSDHMKETVPVPSGDVVLQRTLPDGSELTLSRNKQDVISSQSK